MGWSAKPVSNSKVEFCSPTEQYSRAIPGSSADQRIVEHKIGKTSAKGHKYTIPI